MQTFCSYKAKPYNNQSKYTVYKSNVWNFLKHLKALKHDNQCQVKRFGHKRNSAPLKRKRPKMKLNANT